MASKDISVQVDNQILKLSNLDKILFPFSKIIKAELIQYYQKIAPYMLPHISNRPLSLIRFPDGIDKVKFFAKNKPEWTPQWIASCVVPKTDAPIVDKDTEPINYIIANDSASLVWLANLAAIELHSMTLRSNNFLADVMVFDIDPPEGMPFIEVKKVVWNLKIFLETKNYVPHLKTSGSKGLHIYVPIISAHPTEQIIEHAKNLSKEFILTNPNTTLLLSKERRTNKILIDIFRNHRSQTCASAYSVRGKEGAPISMPLFWEDFEQLNSSQQYNINNAFEYLAAKGDAWASMHTHAIALNNYVSTSIEHNAISPKVEPIAQAIKINNVVEDKHTNETSNTNIGNETSSLLSNYATKRDFTKTAEPLASIEKNDSGLLKYVIQKHQASNLHYDLRLENEGVLLSWAIPKALPTKPGEKRMAIETEPHPMKYLNFEGVIPKEEYGGGEMWVFDTGELNYIKKEDNKIKFILSKGKITGEYSLYRTENNKWLIEKKEVGLLVENISIQPMLANSTLKIPSNSFFEIKWDGIRVIIIKIADHVQILSKSGRDLTEKFPKLAASILEMNLQTAMLDGEIVCLDEKGIPNFSKVISRMHLTGKEAIDGASVHNAATCYVFDMPYLDGMDLRNLPIEKRRKWLQISFTDTHYLRFSQTFEDGQALLDAIKLQNMEGIMCKRSGSIYQSNVRSADWLKLKVRNTEDAIIIGYTKGAGDRSNTFGSLILAQYEHDQLVYKGKVGSGFNSEQLSNFTSLLQKIPTVKKIIKDAIDEESQAVWIEPKLWCEVQIASLTSNNTFREAVFIKMREDVE
jgi:bifunctional non-homologous end joining protein LigD